MPKTSPATPGEEAATPAKRRRRADRTYDAIVIGGGHNGLTNGAYLAKAGPADAHPRAAPPRRRCGDHRGAPAGLLVHDVLVRPEPAPAGHHPRPRARRSTASCRSSCRRRSARWRTATTSSSARTTARTSRRSPATRQHDADAYDAFNHDVNKVIQVIKPLLDKVPPDIFSDDPEELIALAALGQRFRKLDKKVVHDAVRLLTGSAADFLDDYFESDILKGYLASSSIIGTKVGPYSQGSGLVLLYHILGEHDGEMGPGRSTSTATAGSPRCSPGPPSRSGPRSGSSRRSSTSSPGRPGDRRRARDGTEFHAPIVVSALDPRRTFLELVEPRELPTDLVDTIQRFRFQGTSAEGQLRPRRRRRATRPSATGPTSTAGSRTSGRRWSTSSGPSTTRSTAGTRRGRISIARSSRWSTRTWRRPARRS